MTCVASCGDCSDCIEDIKSENKPEVREVPEAVINQWGCICTDQDEGCETCTEFADCEDGGDVKTYPHISELYDPNVEKFIGPALQAYNTNNFRSFINRRCR